MKFKEYISQGIKSVEFDTLDEAYTKQQIMKMRQMLGREGQANKKKGVQIFMDKVKVDKNRATAMWKAAMTESAELNEAKVVAHVVLWNGKKIKKSFKTQSAAENWVKKMEDDEDVRDYKMHAESMIKEEVELEEGWKINKDTYFMGKDVGPVHSHDSGYTIAKISGKWIVSNPDDEKSGEFPSLAKAKSQVADLTESVELNEAKEVTPKDVEDHLVKTGVNPKDAKEAVKKGFEYANKKYGGSTHKAAVKKIAEVVWTLHESVELDEARAAKFSNFMAKPASIKKNRGGADDFRRAQSNSSNGKGGDKSNPRRGSDTVDKDEIYHVIDTKTGKKSNKKPMSKRMAIDHYSSLGGNLKGYAVVKDGDKRIKESVKLDEAKDEIYHVIDKKTGKKSNKTPMSSRMALDYYDSLGGNAKGYAVVKDGDKRIKESSELETTEFSFVEALEKDGPKRPGLDRLRLAKGKKGSEYQKKKAKQRQDMNKKNDPGADKKGLAISVIDKAKAKKKAKKKGVADKLSPYDYISGQKPNRMMKIKKGLD